MMSVATADRLQVSPSRRRRVVFGQAGNRGVDGDVSAMRRVARQPPQRQARKAEAKMTRLMAEGSHTAK